MFKTLEELCLGEGGVGGMGRGRLTIGRGRGGGGGIGSVSVTGGGGGMGNDISVIGREVQEVNSQSLEEEAG